MRETVFVALILAVATTTLSLWVFKAGILNPVSLPVGYLSVVIPSFLALPVVYLYSKNPWVTFLSWFISIPGGYVLYIFTAMLFLV